MGLDIKSIETQLDKQEDIIDIPRSPSPKKQSAKKPYKNSAEMLKWIKNNRYSVAEFKPLKNWKITLSENPDITDGIFMSIPKSLKFLPRQKSQPYKSEG
eukprot:361756_1